MDRDMAKVKNFIRVEAIMKVNFKIMQSMGRVN